jgi:hypothetical protein
MYGKVYRTQLQDLSINTDGQGSVYTGKHLPSHVQRDIGWSHYWEEIEKTGEKKS